jgi:shikimate kinase
MSLLQIFGEYCEEDEAARKAVFEAAMVKRLAKGGEGYKMSDMLYELCDAEARLVVLEAQVEAIEARLNKRAKKVAKGAKGAKSTKKAAEDPED